MLSGQPCNGAMETTTNLLQVLLDHSITASSQKKGKKHQNNHAVIR